MSVSPPSTLASRTLPVVAPWSPIRQLSTVDLPDPDSPMRPSASPGATSNETSQAATTAPVAGLTAVPCSGPVPATAGSVRLASAGGGEIDVLNLSPQRRRRLRIDTMSIVYQDPAAGLDLRVTAGGNIAERHTAAGWRSYHGIRRRAAELLDRVEVPLSRMDDPVATFSGGMRQRVQIAKALATGSPLLLLDEPTTGLDASVAAGVLDLLRGLLRERNVAAVVVSHDFAVIEALTDRTAVMKLGRIVETGLTDQLFHDPHHPYTQRLVAAARR